ncbi:hypothetical protein TCAL_08104 [Tigriopus californicus]|uniref:Nuclear receptor domain-containing protein n=1 Tax=Tigriopus californicus TaxID=6832 RepID=A0A553PQ28_TIGCA|nr:hypothetical protein TCAL_08104 [Tigriopus californicus]
MSNESSGSENKSEPKRSKICSVCNDTSKNFHLNYGAPTCSSCRAFFRRAHRRTVSSELVCQFGNSCQITPETRRNCSKCRFDQCINVGMKVSLVLDEGQKQERFRRSLRKKQGDQPKLSTLSRSSSFKEPSSSVSSSEDRADDDEDGSGNNSLMNDGFTVTSHGFYCPDLGSRGVERIFPAQTLWPKGPADRNLHELWGKLIQEVKINPIFEAGLVQFHLAGVALSEVTFFKHMATLRQVFLEFALNAYWMLDQHHTLLNQMIAKQSRVFLLCILAKYFTADYGSHQIAWLTLGRHSVAVPLVTLAQWKGSVRIFQNESFSQRFQVLAIQLKNFCKFPQSLPELAWSCLNVHAMHPYKASLDQLGAFEFLDDLPSPQLSIMGSTTLTLNERDWIKSHLKLIRTSIAKIPFEGYKGTPMELKSAWHLMGIWSQRTLLILQQFDMFRELSLQDQVVIWETSFIPFYSVICSKVVSLDLLVDQLQFQAATLDRPHLLELCAPMRLEEIKSPNVKEFSVKSPFLSQEAARRMDQIHMDMEIFIKDDLAFALSLLSTLFLSATRKIPITQMGRQGFAFQNLLAKLLCERAGDNLVIESSFYQNINELADLIQSAAL